MRWDANGTAGEYDVLVDGVARAEDQPFGAALSTVRGVERVGLYVLGEGRVWFDEIYLGPDFTMGEIEDDIGSFILARGFTVVKPRILGSPI